MTDSIDEKYPLYSETDKNLIRELGEDNPKIQPLHFARNISSNIQFSFKGKEK